MTPLSQLEYVANHALLTFLAWQPEARPSGGGTGGGAAHAAPSGAAQMLNNFLPLVVVAFIYFFMLRPMSKQKKEEEETQKALRKGDRVVTSSGIIGTLHELEEREAVIETTEKTRIRVLRSTITKKYDPAADARAAQAKS
jgi:preprotein translocase subunit YajC